MREIHQPAGTVTLVFTDIEGSTRLLAELGEGGYRDALREHRRVVRDAFERFDGYEVDYEGDAFFYTFGSAKEAISAVAEAMRGLEEGPIRVRVGVHTGEPALDPPKYVGLDVHRAARVMAAGHGGQVLLTERTCALLDDSFELRELGDHRLKDFDGPQRLYQLHLKGLRTEFPPLKTISNTNLPRPASSFVGRAREVAEVVGLLREQARLVTLTGPGGMGKTRLSLQAAAELVPAFTAGVFWVPLATLREPGLLLDTIARTLGAREELAAHIGSRDLLLVLDNFEQLIDGAPLLGELLRACPNLALLVTSRETLRIDGEREYAVLPLPPDDGVELFCARATTAPDGAIAELCRRLDNLPLAIELAAARAKALGPEQLLERLSRRLDILKGGRDADPRQQTLRATVAWSHDLLSPGEQALFAGVAIFTGGFGLEAAEEICGADLDELSSLVDKSLVNRTGERYWLYETIRQFAAERLDESGSRNELEARHTRWFTELAERADVASRTADRSGWFDRLEADHENLRATVVRAHDADDRELELRLVTSLWRYWADRGYVGEGLRFFDQALERAHQPPVAALLGHCYLRSMTSWDFAGLLVDAGSVSAAAEAEGDRFTLVQALALRGLSEMGIGRHAAADDALERALELADGRYPAEEGEAFGWWLINGLWGPLPAERGIARCEDARVRAPDNAVVRAFSLVEQAPLEAMRGSFDEARRLIAEGRAGFESLGLPVWSANVGQEIYVVEMLAGDPDAAVRELTDSFDRLSATGERGFLSTIAGYLAHALFAQGDLTAAGRFADVAGEYAAADDYVSRTLSVSAMAKVAARRGDIDTAVDQARSATRIVRATDAAMRADRLADLADVLELAGENVEAVERRRQALELYEQKQNRVAAARMRASLESARADSA